MGFIRKTIKKIAFFILLAFFVISIMAMFDLKYTGNIVKEGFTAKYALEHTNEAISGYNKNFENIPNFAKTLFGNERVDLMITMNNGSLEELFFITKNGKIIEYSSNHLQDITIVVEITEEVFDLISSSQKPSNDFAKAMKENKLKVKPKRMASRFKVFAAKSYFKVKNWF